MDGRPLSGALLKSEGQDIEKKGRLRKKGKFIFSLPGVFAAKGAGRIGSVRDLDTPKPKLVFEGGDGRRIELTGRVVLATRPLMALRVQGKALACKEVYDRVVVFDEEPVWTDVEEPGGGKESVPPVAAREAKAAPAGDADADAVDADADADADDDDDDDDDFEYGVSAVARPRDAGEGSSKKLARKSQSKPASRPVRKSVADAASASKKRPPDSDDLEEDADDDDEVVVLDREDAHDASSRRSSRARNSVTYKDNENSEEEEEEEEAVEEDEEGDDDEYAFTG